MDTDAVLLVGHGTRNPLGTQQFLHLAHCVAQRIAPLPLEPAFLEIQQPDIATAISRLARQGVRRVAVVPLLLFAAGHAKQDIPHAIRQAARELELSPSLEFRQSPHLGCHPALVELSQRRFAQASVGLSPLPADQCGLILVGRGSSDAAAIGEMRQFVELRKGQPPTPPRTEVAFLDVAQPLLHNQLQAFSLSGLKRVFVQPHLLFNGELIAQLRRDVSAYQGKQNVEWIVTAALADECGTDSLATEHLLPAIVDRWKGCRATDSCCT